MAFYKPKPVTPPTVDPVTGEPIRQITDPKDPASAGASVPIDPGTGLSTQPVGGGAMKPGAPQDQSGDIIFNDGSQGNGPGPTPATDPNAAPAYDPNNPDPWIIYNYKIGNNGQAPDASQLDYWHKKLASGEITGTGQPADYNYWGTRLRRQGVDDLNPQGAAQKTAGGYLGAANQYGGLFGNGGYSGFLGSSMVPTDAGASETLQNIIKSILGGGGGLNSRPSSSVVDAAVGNGSAGGGSSAAAPVGAPATPAAANSNPAAPAYGTVTPGPNPFTPGSGGSGDTKARDASIIGGLLAPRATNDAVASPIANQNPSVLPDRAAGAITSMFGLSPILAAGNAAQRLNHPGDIIFGNPAGAPQGPTDPNLQPTTPEEQQRNAQILAQLLGNNEANGGI